MTDNVLRKSAEEIYKKEIEALIADEKDPIPVGWKKRESPLVTFCCALLSPSPN